MDANDRLNSTRTHIFKIWKVRERGSESEKERGERKLTWVGVNGSLGFCPFWRERREKREEREMERERKRKR